MARRHADGNVRVSTWLQQIAQDLRSAARVLRQSPAFVATTVLTLAVGISVVSVAFAVFNAYVLRPYAVRDPYSLHDIAWRSRDAFETRFTWRQYEELRARRDLFTEAIADRTRYGSSDGRTLTAAFVSGNYWTATACRPIRWDSARAIGIRMALGATAAAVVRQVMGQSARLVGIGAAAGLVFAWSVMKVLSAVIRLQQVSLLDLTPFAVGVVLVVAAAALATCLPARRASAIDPSTTLRSEA